MLRLHFCLLTPRGSHANSHYMSRQQGYRRLIRAFVSRSSVAVLRSMHRTITSCGVVARSSSVDKGDFSCGVHQPKSEGNFVDDEDDNNDDATLSESDSTDGYEAELDTGGGFDTSAGMKKRMFAPLVWRCSVKCPLCSGPHSVVITTSNPLLIRFRYRFLPSWKRNYLRIEKSCELSAAVCLTAAIV